MAWSLWNWRDRASATAERAREEQDREYRAAVRRILEEPTRPLPTVRVTPLLTPGRGGGRRP